MNKKSQFDHVSRSCAKGLRKVATTLAGLFVAVAALSLAACGDDDLDSNVTPATTPTSVEFNLPEELQQLIYTDNTNSQCLPLIKGETVKLPYTLEPATATFSDVEWTSSNEAVATVDQEGNVNAISGDGTGFSVISVTPAGFLASGGISASLKVVVSNQLVPAQSIGINAASEELYGGDTQQLSVAISPDNATYKTVKWTSSDESVATIDANGLMTAQVTEATSAEVTITATALDGSGVVGQKTFTVRQIVQPEEVIIAPEFDNSIWAFNEKSVTLTYTTEPAQCTTSLIEWTSSDPAVATVENGIVTFTGRGSVTITATCPETGQSSSVKLNVPSGLVRELYHDENNLAFLPDTYDWSYGCLTVRTAHSGTNWRGDLRNKQNIYLNAGNYPIIAVRMEDALDMGASQRNITLDSSADGYSGGLNGNNNKWLHDYKCDDGSHVFVYDLTQQKWATGGLMDANKEVEFRTLQFKYADIKGLDDRDAVNYKVYWLQTFKSLQDVIDYIQGEGLTYETIK